MPQCEWFCCILCINCLYVSLFFFFARKFVIHKKKSYLGFPLDLDCKSKFVWASVIKRMLGRLEEAPLLS